MEQASARVLFALLEERRPAARRRLLLLARCLSLLRRLLPLPTSTAAGAGAGGADVIHDCEQADFLHVRPLLVLLLFGASLFVGLSSPGLLGLDEGRLGRVEPVRGPAAVGPPRLQVHLAAAASNARNVHEARVFVLQPGPQLDLLVHATTDAAGRAFFSVGQRGLGLASTAPLVASYVVVLCVDILICGLE